ncbi:MAG: hypothetical protein H6Q72_3689 [Firmicutes bacterium]|nr:hypothetical protein [Bacillota bacterium]
MGDTGLSMKKFHKIDQHLFDILDNNTNLSECVDCK